MSTYRIKGDDGVIVDSAKYLELPKGPDSARPTNPRAGMMRYNDQATSRGIEASVIVESAGKQSLEWRRVAHLDKDGKLLTSQLPSTITGSLTYKGTWDADYNDVNETADDTSLDDRLPSAAGRVGHYYIVRTNGDGGVARGQAPTDLAPVTSNPKYRKGDWIVSNGATWEKVDQSQITTTAAQVQLVTTSMRPNKHAMSGSVSLQDAMDGLVEHALDRFEDTILGTITVSNDKNAYPDARILLADGSAAKPNLAFGTSPTTGLYWAAANTIGFSANNGMRLTLSPSILTSAVTVRNINGDAGTPSYSFTDSAKAGMYRVGADIVGISTSGAERARFYADGIRTLTLLANKGSTDKVAYGFTEADDKHTPDIGTGIYSPAAKQVTIATNKAQTATFSESQVTTLVPVRVSAGSTNLPSLSFTGDNTTGVWLNGTGKLSLSATEVEAVTITKTSVSTNIQSLFFNGTATAPGISFKDETNSGLQWVSKNQIDMVTGGTAVMTFGLTDVVFKGETYIKDGTAATPGLAFASDHTTGIFKAAATTLGLTAGGKLGLSINEDQLVSVAKRLDVPTATAAAPNITFAGQTTCGLFGATDKVGVSVGGVEQLGITKVATTVATKLVVPAGTAAAPKFTLGTDNTGLYAPSSGKIGISAGGTTNMEFDATTNFSKLQLRVPVGTLALPSIVFDGDENTGLYRKGATTDPDNITFVANGAEIFQVTPTYTNPLTPVKLLDGSTTAPSLCFDTKQNTGLFYANGGVSVTAENDTVLAMTKSGITASKTVGLGTNSLTFGTDASIKTAATSNSTMAFKSGNTATTFTFGRDTAIYTTIFKDGLIVPVGTTANRPATPAVGTIRYNSDTKNLEAYVNTDWADLAGSGKIVSTGTEGAPAITLGTSTTTGIFSDATDTISFAAKGVKQLTISDAGAVFTNPIQINTGTGNVKIGSNNSSWIHFIGDKAFHFNKQVQAEDGFKVFNKDTALQSDGKIKEDGTLLENKYAQFTPTSSTIAAYAPGTKNIEVEKNSSIYWYNSSNFAKIMFVHSGVDTGTDQHLLFETGDNDDEYFKFAHKLSGAATNTEWMSIKKAGIAVSGKTSTIGDWTMTATGLQFKGSSVISIDSSGNVSVNGSATGSSGVAHGGGTMTGQLTFNSAPAAGGTTAQIYHDGNGTNGTAMNVRAIRESQASKIIWEKVADGVLYYNVDTNSGSGITGKIKLDPVTGDIFLSDGTKKVYHEGNLSASTIQAADRTHTHAFADVSGVAAASHRHAFADLDGVAAASHSHTAADVGAVPTSRKVNNKALTADITLGASDVGASPTAHTHTGALNTPIVLGTEDLDTLKTPGHYAQHANVNTSAGRHYPENNAGGLIVTSGAGVQQRYHVHNTNRIYTRAQYDSGPWTAWSLNFNTTNPPTAANVGAVANTGDTMTGNLFAPAVLVSSAQNASPNALTRKDYVDGQVATMAPTTHTHTAAQGNADIVAIGWGHIGTYMLAAVIPGHAADMNPADTIAGSSLRAANCSEWGQNRGWALPGTWKCLGFVSDQQDDRWDDRTTLWIRIA